MNRKYLYKYVISSILIVISFSIVFIMIDKIEYNNYKENSNYKINRLDNSTKQAPEKVLVFYILFII